MTGQEQKEQRPFPTFSIFPESVLQETRTMQLTPDIFKGRREVPGITIDGPLSKDLDDAIWVEPQGGGHIVYVSIADVASLVTPGSELDSEAYQRTTTRYFGNGNNPMIPRPLSEDLLSLREQQKRPTITVVIPLDENLNMERVMIEPTVLESKKRFAYGEVDEAMQDGEHPLNAAFNEYYRIAKKLLQNRREKGALAIYDIFKGIATTEEGMVVVLGPEDKHMANVIIQEFMILANQAVAQYFAEKDIPALFRNHTAKAIAPGREIILQDMENAVAYPATFNLDTLCERIAVSLNRAYYGPELVGHYGLNLSAYVHFTSPIRRYADLVNHRILLASLKGEPLLYTPEQLSVIGNHLNTTERGIKDARSAALKERGYSRARNATETNRLVRLSDKDFTTLIKVAAREGKMNDEVAEAMIQRLKDGKLAINDVFMLLLGPQDRTEAWQKVHEEIINWLRENPAHAITITTMAKQSLNWPNIIYETSFEGPDHARTFTSLATIKIKDVEIISEKVKAGTQKVSQQLATVDLLSTIVGQKVKKEDNDTEVTPSRGETVLWQQREAQPFQQPQISTKNALQEVCQQRKWQLPSYIVEQEGPSHMPTFRARTELTINGKKVISDEVKGASRKDAEQRAAASLLERLGVNPVQPAQRTEKPIEVISDNYIGALQTLAQRNHWCPPSYEVSQFGKSAEEGFACTVRVKTDTGLVTIRGVGKNSKEARQKAAEAIFQQISGLQ